MSQEDKCSIRCTVAKNVCKYRELRGFTREKLSLLLGYDNSYISKLEKSKVNASIDMLEHLAQILDIPYIKLFEEE